MKKLLIALPLAMCMSYAWSQTDMDKSQQTATSLDGKSYKITLMSADVTQTTKGKTMDNPSDQVGYPNQSTVDKQDHTKADYDNKTMAPEGKDGMSQNKNDKMKNPNKDVMENKTIIINFENGMINSSFLANKQIDGCPYTITTGTTGRTDFKATCSKMTDASGATSTNPTERTTTGNPTGNNATASTSSVCTWTGTVEGKNITGYFNKMKSDGKVISYTFTGIETTEKDMGKDLGMQ